MNLIEDMKAAAARLLNVNNTAVETLAQMRNGILEHRRTHQRIRAAHRPMAEVRRNARAEVAEVAEFFRQGYGQTLLHGERALTQPSVTNNFRLPWNLREPLPWGLLCWADPDLAERLLVTAIGKLYAQDGIEEGLPEADRARELLRLERELQEAEAAEEAAVDDAIAAGIGIAHRPEVVARRESEEQLRRRDEAAKRHAREREAAINARVGQPRNRFEPSHYLETGTAGR